MTSFPTRRSSDLVEAVDALRADARHQLLIRLADFEVLVRTEIGLDEAGRAHGAHGALDPVAGRRIAAHLDEVAAAFHEHWSAPNADVAGDRRARVGLLEQSEHGVEIP